MAYAETTKPANDTGPTFRSGHIPFETWTADRLVEAAGDAALVSHRTEAQDALAAASATTEATAELIRFAREGALSTSFAFEIDTIEKLADALHTAIRIERPRIISASDPDPQGVELLDDLSHALMLFLESWA